MKKEQTSQADFYNILVSELKTLETTRKEYERLTHSLKTDLDGFTSLHKQFASLDSKSDTTCEQIKNVLNDSICIPRWFIIGFLGAVFSLFISLCFNYRQHVINLHNKYFIERCREYIAALEDELPKKKSKAK